MYNPIHLHCLISKVSFPTHTCRFLNDREQYKSKKGTRRRSCCSMMSAINRHRPVIPACLLQEGQDRRITVTPVYWIWVSNSGRDPASNKWVRSDRRHWHPLLTSVCTRTHTHSHTHTKEIKNINHQPKITIRGSQLKEATVKAIILYKQWQSLIYSKNFCDLTQCSCSFIYYTGGMLIEDILIPRNWSLALAGC